MDQCTIDHMCIIATVTAVLTAIYAIMNFGDPFVSRFGQTTIAPVANEGQSGSDDRDVPQGPSREWQTITFGSLRDAEDWLDTLENHGITEREFIVVNESRFVVRWKK